MENLYLVINMESRVERYQRRKRRTLFQLYKLVVLICLLITLIYFLFEVNNSIKELNLLENTALLEVDFSKKTISIFGNTYYVK